MQCAHHQSPSRSGPSRAEGREIFSGLSDVEAAPNFLTSRNCCLSRWFSLLSRSVLSAAFSSSRRRSPPPRPPPRDALRPRRDRQPSSSCAQRPLAIAVLAGVEGAPPPPWWRARRSLACATASTARARCRPRRRRRCHDGSAVAMAARCRRGSGGNGRRWWAAGCSDERLRPLSHEGVPRPRGDPAAATTRFAETPLSRLATQPAQKHRCVSRT